MGVLRRAPPDDATGTVASDGSCYLRSSGGLDPGGLGRSLGTIGSVFGPGSGITDAAGGSTDRSNCCRQQTGRWSTTGSAGLKDRTERPKRNGPATSTGSVASEDRDVSPGGQGESAEVRATRSDRAGSRLRRVPAQNEVRTSQRQRTDHQPGVKTQCRQGVSSGCRLTAQ